MKKKNIINEEYATHEDLQVVREMLAALKIQIAQLKKDLKIK